MTWSTRLVATLVVFALFAGEAKAQTITITSNTPGSQKVTIVGKYTLGGKIFDKVTVDARPAGGVAGQGGEKLASTDTCAMTFSGTVSNIPAGKYDLQATLVLTDGTKTYYYYSAVVKGVTVTP